MNASSDPGIDPQASATRTSTTGAAVLARCDQLAGFTSRDDGLIERVYLSDEHRQASDLVGVWMTDAGLTTWVDQAATRHGRVEGREAALPALLLGSHLDTVPVAGRYDGILGVLIGVAVAERLVADGRASELPFALQVVAFGDEEGTRFGRTLLGSRALAGTWDASWLHLVDRDGVSMRRAFFDFGLDPDAVADAALDPASVVGYLEAHIEQMPYLERADRALGIVSSIAGARRFVLTVDGHAGHAGTPFELRRDALVGASLMVPEIERLARERDLVATVGSIRAYPGAVNVVPGRVEFSLDVRGEFDDQRDEGLAAIRAECLGIAERRGLRLSMTQTHAASAVRCAGALQGAVRAGIAATGDDDPLVLFSRAGHDAMAVADLTGVGMLFVRCAGGISHHPDESVTESDVDAAIDAMEAAVLHLAAGRN